MARFNVFIKPNGDQSVCLDVSPSDTVGSVKDRLQHIKGTPRGCHRLVFGGQLKDDSTLAMCHITEGATLHLLGRLPGGNSKRHPCWLWFSRVLLLLGVAGVFIGQGLMWTNGTSVFTIDYLDMKAEEAMFPETNSFWHPININIARLSLDFEWATDEIVAFVASNPHLQRRSKRSQMAAWMTTLDAESMPLRFSRSITKSAHQRLLPVLEAANMLKKSRHTRNLVLDEVFDRDFNVLSDAEDDEESVFPEWLRFEGVFNTTEGIVVRLAANPGILTNYESGIGTYLLNHNNFWNCRQMVDTRMPSGQKVIPESGRIVLPLGDDEGFPTPDFWYPLAETVNAIIQDAKPTDSFPFPIGDISDECWAIAAPSLNETDWGLHPWPTEAPFWWDDTWWYEGPLWWCPDRNENCTNTIELPKPDFWDECIGRLIPYIPPGQLADWPLKDLEYPLPVPDMEWPGNHMANNISLVWEDADVPAFEDDFRKWVVEACTGDKNSFFFYMIWSWVWWVVGSIFAIYAIFRKSKCARYLTNFFYSACWTLIIIEIVWMYDHTSTEAHLLNDCCGDYKGTNSGPGDGNSYMFTFLQVCTVCNDNNTELTLALAWLDLLHWFYGSAFCLMFTSVWVVAGLGLMYNVEGKSDSGDNTPMPESASVTPSAAGYAPSHETSLLAEDFSNDFSNTPYGRVQRE